MQYPYYDKSRKAAPAASNESHQVETLYESDIMRIAQYKMNESNHKPNIRKLALKWAISLLSKKAKSDEETNLCHACSKIIASGEDFLWQLDTLYDEHVNKQIPKVTKMQEEKTIVQEKKQDNVPVPEKTMRSKLVMCCAVLSIMCVMAITVFISCAMVWFYIDRYDNKMFQSKLVKPIVDDAVNQKMNQFQHDHMRRIDDRRRKNDATIKLHSSSATDRNVKVIEMRKSFNTMGLLSTSFRVAMMKKTQAVKENLYVSFEGNVSVANKPFAMHVDTALMNVSSNIMILADATESAINHTKEVYDNISCLINKSNEQHSLEIEDIRTQVDVISNVTRSEIQSVTEHMLLIAQNDRKANTDRFRALENGHNDLVAPVNRWLEFEQKQKTNIIKESCWKKIQFAIMLGGIAYAASSSKNKVINDAKGGFVGKAIEGALCGFTGALIPMVNLVSKDDPSWWDYFVNGAVILFNFAMPNDGMLEGAFWARVTINPFISDVDVMWYSTMYIMDAVTGGFATDALRAYEKVTNFFKPSKQSLVA
jgi:hypothetical protein